MNSIGESVKSYETSTVLKLLRVLNLVNSVGVVALGVVNLLNLAGFEKSRWPIGLVSVHLVLFGVLLFLYEARVGKRYEGFFRQNFGFLYGQWGRLIFLVFLATLCFATEGSLMSWLVGGITVVNAVLNCFVIRHHPGFQTGDPEAEGISPPPESQPPTVETSPGASGLYSMSASAYGQTSIASETKITEATPSPENPFAASRV